MTFRQDDGDRDKFDKSLHHYTPKKFDHNLHYITPSKVPIHPEDKIIKYEYLSNIENKITTKVENIFRSVTYIYDVNIKTNGYIKQIQTETLIAASLVFKLFTKTSTHFLFVREYYFSLQAGLNTISCHIPVTDNTYIGLYTGNTLEPYIYRELSSSKLYYHLSNVTSDKLISDYNDMDRIPSLKMNIVYKRREV